MQQPGQLREGERPEFQYRGPFGGIQATLPSSMREALFGFDDAVNITFRYGMATVRPGFTALTAMPAGSGQINGIVNFFNANGALIQCVITPTKLLQWQGPSIGWVEITKSDGALTGSAANQFNYDSIGYKLAFSQGIDKVQLWDGISPTYATSSANAPVARFMAELAEHLITGYVTQGGNTFPQRFVWSGLNDATDWTSFSAGQSDQLNNFGAITGILKLNQYGYGFQQRGISIIQPTGLGVAPFAITPFGARARGNVCPLSLDVYNETLAFYVGDDNVYMFTGSSSEPVGEMPLQGRMKQGAWPRISADLQAADLNKVIGVVTTAINGRRFNAYWIFIPNVSCWVYNIDEQNWTRFTFGKTVSRAEFFNNNGVIRIIDLVGQIQDQQWTPATLQNTNPLESFLIGFTDGTPGLIDYTTFSEQSASLTFPQLIMGDQRHEKKIDAVRIVYQDLGQCQISITISNEKGETRTPLQSGSVVSGNPITFGTGSGNIQTLIVTFPPLTGMYIKPSITTAAAQPFSMLECTPFYQVANEYKSNTF